MRPQRPSAARRQVATTWLGLRAASNGGAWPATSSDGAIGDVETGDAAEARVMLVDETRKRVLVTSAKRLDHSPAASSSGLGVYHGSAAHSGLARGLDDGQKGA